MSRMILKCADDLLQSCHKKNRVLYLDRRVGSSRHEEFFFLTHSFFINEKNAENIDDEHQIFKSLNLFEFFVLNLWQKMNPA